MSAVEDATDEDAPDPTSQGTAVWVAGLTSEGEQRTQTIERLHGLLQRIARSEANRRAGLNGIEGQELDDLADQAASDALVSILRRLPDFRGDSKFTTWAYKFVMFEVSSKFGRHAWRRDSVWLGEDAWDRLPSALGADPERVAESRELVDAVRRAVDEELTSHQRRVFVAIIVNATPLDVLVAELDTNRNAIYKTLFDARRKLHRHLVTHGYLDSGRGTL